MKIMVDANIIISAVLFPKSIISETLKHIVSNYKIILSQYTIDEINMVFNNKFPHRTGEMNKYFEKLPYELFVLKKIDEKKYPAIRDIGDIPVLAHAIESNADIFITGDKDFEEIKTRKPKIMKPKEYKDKYMKKELTGYFGKITLDVDLDKLRKR